MKLEDIVKKIPLLIKLFITYLMITNSNALLNKHYTKCNKCNKCSNGFTGSGILLYEKNNYNEKIFILGLDYKNELTDFGGKIDNTNEKVYETAIREFNEETKGILNLTRKHIDPLKRIDIDRYNHTYRCYIVKTDYFDINKFKSTKIVESNLDLNEIITIIKINENKLKRIVTDKNNDKEYKTFPYEISPRLMTILKSYYSSI